MRHKVCGQFVHPAPKSDKTKAYGYRPLAKKPSRFRFNACQALNLQMPLQIHNHMRLSVIIKCTNTLSMHYKIMFERLMILLNKDASKNVGGTTVSESFI